VFLFGYWEFITNVDLSPDVLDVHLWIFWTLLLLGALAAAAFAAARMRS
jgi:hypothetical protein